MKGSYYPASKAKAPWNYEK